MDPVGYQGIIFSVKQFTFFALPALLIGLSSGTQAAQYYNCGTDSGCVPVRVLATSDQLKTRYPIVFAHGFSGFNNIGPVNYWYQIPEELARGGATSYVTKVTAFNDSDLRGEQLLQQVEEILAIRGEPNGKVNLIGHSQGGFSARYVLGVRPDLVASVTSVGSPHAGTLVADAILQARQGLSSSGTLGQLTAAGAVTLFNNFGKLIGLLSGGGEVGPQNIEAALRSFSVASVSSFNTRFPLGLPAQRCGEGSYTVNDGARKINLYSWTGIGSVTNVADASDYVLKPFRTLLNEKSDSLIGQCSAHFGRVTSDSYNMNHLDEINQLFGLVDIFSVNPKTVYRLHALRLKADGQ